MVVRQRTKQRTSDILYYYSDLVRAVSVAILLGLAGGLVYGGITYYNAKTAEDAARTDPGGLPLEPGVVAPGRPAKATPVDSDEDSVLTIVMYVLAGLAIFAAAILIIWGLYYFLGHAFSKDFVDGVIGRISTSHQSDKLTTLRQVVDNKWGDFTMAQRRDVVKRLGWLYVQTKLLDTDVSFRDEWQALADEYKEVEVAAKRFTNKDMSAVARAEVVGFRHRDYLARVATLTTKIEDRRVAMDASMVQLFRVPDEAMAGEEGGHRAFWAFLSDGGDQLSRFGGKVSRFFGGGPRGPEDAHVGGQLDGDVR
jgi:hypothetical protein